MRRGSGAPAAGEGRNPGGGRGGNPEQRLKALTESLTLTAEQQEKIKKILEEGRTEMQALREGPEEGRREKVRAAQTAQREKINAVLTPEQQEKYKNMAPQRGGQRRDGAGDAAKPNGDKPADKK